MRENVFDVCQRFAHFMTVCFIEESEQRRRPPMVNVMKLAAQIDDMIEYALGFRGVSRLKRRSDPFRAR